MSKRETHHRRECDVSTVLQKKFNHTLMTLERSYMQRSPPPLHTVITSTHTYKHMDHIDSSACRSI